MSASKGAKAKSKDAPKEVKQVKKDTIKVANSNVEADAPLKKPRKRAAKAEDGPSKPDAREKEKPARKAKTGKAKESEASEIVATEPQVEVDVAGVEPVKTTAGKKGKATKEDKPNATAPKTKEPASGKKTTKAKASKAKEDSEDASASKQLTDSLETAIQVAPNGVEEGMPSIEEASKNLLDAAKEVAAGAFKKAEAIVVEQPAQKKEPKSKKRKATEETDVAAAVTEADAPSPATTTKKQKKNKATAGSAVTSIRDRVSSFLSTIGDAVGAKSIADDVVGVAEDAVEAKIEDEKKEKSKASGRKGKGKVETPAVEKNGDDGDEDEWEPDDQTASLIRGFSESDGEDEDSGDEGFKDGKALPKPPGKLTKKLKAANSGVDNSEESGVIYIGRIPRGFHEHEMFSYFSQFGNVRRLRLSRSKKSGRSKHYAFLEFDSGEVAKIVADTMNNYLLFGHLLKCCIISKEQVHPNLWVGANKRFKAVPWARIEGRKLAQPQGRSQWDKRVEKENERRQKKAAMLKDVMGYEVEFPSVEGTASVPKKNKKTKAIEAPKDKEAEEKTIVVAEDGEEGAVVVNEEVKSTKEKKGGKKKEEKAIKDDSKPAKTPKAAKEAPQKKEKVTKDDAKPAKAPKVAKEASAKKEKAKGDDVKPAKAPAKKEKAEKATSKVTKTPKTKAKATAAEEAKAEGLTPSSSKRTPKPSKRALEAQEFEATAPRKTKKAKKE